MQAYFWSGSAEKIILRCCHLGRGSARGLERVKSDPKGKDDWLRNKGGGRAPQPPSNTRTKFIIQRSPMKNACTAGYLESSGVKSNAKAKLSLNNSQLTKQHSKEKWVSLS